MITSHPLLLVPYLISFAGGYVKVGGVVVPTGMSGPSGGECTEGDSSGENHLRASAGSTDHYQNPVVGNAKSDQLLTVLRSRFIHHRPHFEARQDYAPGKLSSPLESDVSATFLILALTMILSSSCDLEEIPDELPAATPTYEAVDAAYGGATGLALLANSGLLLTGSTDGEVYLRRMDAEGTVTLDRSYPYSGRDAARDVLELADGTYVVVGTTYNAGSRDKDGFFLRTRADGEPLVGPIGLQLDNSDESLDKVTELSDGSLLMIGSALAEGSDQKDIYLLRYSPNLLINHFHKVVPLPENETAWDVVGLDDGFIVVGAIYDGTLIGLFARFDLDGNLLDGQPRRFTEGEGYFTHINKVADRKFIITGVGTDTGDFDVLLLQTDDQGVAASGFPKRFGGEEGEFIASADVTADGGLILAGALFSNSTIDALLIKTTASFGEAWRVTSGVNSHDGFAQVVTMPDGGYGVCGDRGESLYYAKTNHLGRVE